MWLVPSHSRRVIPRFHSELDEFFRGVTATEGQWFSPRLDIRGDEKAYHISIEVPGIAKEDIEISLKDHVLVVKGEKKQDGKEDKDGNSWVERSYGSFQRTVRLPEDAKGDQVEARLETGILEITLPKSEQPERKQIAIN